MGIAANAGSDEFELSASEFQAICKSVYRHTGIALSDSKQHLVYSRLARRLRHANMSCFTDYLDLIEHDATEREEFCNAITTNLTSFFRELHHFEHLAAVVLPALQRSKAQSRKIRIWSAGCSTGEEPYSIAMTLLETLGRMPDWDIRILATDLDSNVLATAQAGVYGQDRFEKMAQSRIDRWFVRDQQGEKLTANDELKRLISFKRLNLIEPWPVRGPFDVIFCRNVVIYFDRPTQRQIFAQMAALQHAGDHLFIGHSESLNNISSDYKPLGKTMYRRLP